MARDWRWPLLLVTLVIASGFVDFRIRQFPDYPYTDYIPKVLDGTYGAPAIYRVLIPYANTWLGDVTGWSPATVWHATRLAWFFAAYLALFAYLRVWVTPEAAFGGVAGVAATLPLTYTNSWAHPDGIPELALFTLGCLAIVRSADVAFAAILAVAALNRETAGFLVITYFAARPITLRHVVRTAVFAAICGAILAGLRLWRGVEHYDYWQLGRNLRFLGLLPPGYDIYKRAYAWFIVVLALPSLIVVGSRWPRVPPTARRLLVSAVPFVATAVTLSSIIETRIFLNLYPLILPALMCSAVQPKRALEEYPGGD